MWMPLPRIQVCMVAASTPLNEAAVMVKWFMDPRQALSAHELAEGLRIIAEHMTGKDHTDA